jgi:hypothetical protein
MGGRQQVLLNTVVPSGRHIDILEVPGGVTVKGSADKVPDSTKKALLELVLTHCCRERSEVVSDHFTPGSFVTASENMIKF